MKNIFKSIQAIYSIYAFLVFILLMFLFLPFIYIASLFGKIKGGNVVYIICTLWADLAMVCWGMYHNNYYEENYDLKKPGIYVFNHISFMDVPILMKTFRNIKMRVLGKVEMIKVPIFGFIYKSAVVTVDRSSQENRAKSVKQLTSVLTKNVSIVLAPEGTFNMTHKPLKDFYDGAFKIALETNTPIRPVIFLDAYDRLNYKSIFSLTPGRSRSVFLPEIPVDKFSIMDMELLKQKVFSAMETELIKANASWIKKNVNA
ncbi:MAG: lysophospholipid acyltransferase family protein [Ferruginibacter sp.]